MFSDFDQASGQECELNGSCIRCFMFFAAFLCLRSTLISNYEHYSDEAL